MSKIEAIDSFFQRKARYFLFLALFIIAIHQAVFWGWTSDDSFISYRYAKNFSSGHGLVFNLGEKVEGFSNFLWVLILAFFNLLSIEPLFSSKFISFCVSLLMIYISYRTALAFKLDRLTSALCSLTLSFSTSLAYYSMSGLETVFYAFLLLLAVFINEKYENEPTQKYFFALYGILLAAAMTRPEGLLFFLLSSIYHFLKKIVTKKGIHIKNILIIQLLFLSIYAFLIVLRYLYYSDILPNTFYAKPKGTFIEQGYNAFYANFVNALFSGSYLLIPILVLFTQKKLLKKYIYPLLFFTGQLFFMSYAGDWMAFGRFFLPTLPLVIILFFTLLSLIRLHYEQSSSKLKWKFVSIVAILLFAGLNVYQTKKAILHQDSYPYNVMNSSQLVQLGKWLNQKSPPETVIALRRQGAIPYYSKMKSIDILGLTEKKIAKNIYREKDLIKQNQINAAYILKQKPNIIILFPFTSEYEGFQFDKSKPEEKLFYIEYLLYKQALQEGYKNLNCMPLGRMKKICLLASERDESDR
jgi:hypothetical protein